ncbi:MAG: PAS domain S-box protein [Alkalicoccus sp.]|nr:MAG: PAS domain S-box protein [Alkalicoccus sp.]
MDILLNGTKREIEHFLNDTPIPEPFNICGIVITTNEKTDFKIPEYNSLKEAEKAVPHALIIGEKAEISFQSGRGLIKRLHENYRELQVVRRRNKKLHKIVNSTHDGMIAIDGEEKITLINRRAEEMTGLSAESSIGKYIQKEMPSSRLPRVLKTKKTEFNRKQQIGENRTIITTRVPMYDEGAIIGVLAVFRDITEIENMAEEVTNLKSIRTMLEAIIESSNDAISVVDNEGHGLLINPAYTRLTGLTKGEVIGKPAATDISEGESIHMKVLQSGSSVRGARMKVGPSRRDVVVNAAPLIVDEAVQGSVGVIHDVSEMEALTTELEQARRIIRTLEAKYEFADIAGNSSELQMAVDQAKAAAKTPAAILLRGESGTGKELFAHAVHNESRRKYNRFVRVNCAALSETLLESELFGYVEGAFSGARRGGKKGLFEEADKGSIFLDEIGELSAKMQAKLLRVLQEGEIVKVGGTKSEEVDVRIIAATNVDIEKKIESGEFRQDLYYRLNRVPIYIPALRERSEDIPVISTYLLEKLNQEYGRFVQEISEEALLKLQQYQWPGNVRELENVLGRAIIHMSQSARIIQVSDLFPEEEKTGMLLEKTGTSQKIPLADQIEKAEKKALQQALIEENGNKTKTARRLHISLRSLYYKMEKHNL